MKKAFTLEVLTDFKRDNTRSKKSLKIIHYTIRKIEDVNMVRISIIATYLTNLENDMKWLS